MCDMMKLALIFKLVEDLRKKNLSFLLDKIFPSKRVNLF